MTTNGGDGKHTEDDGSRRGRYLNELGNEGPNRGESGSECASRKSDNGWSPGSEKSNEELDREVPIVVWTLYNPSPISRTT